MQSECQRCGCVFVRSCACVLCACACSLPTEPYLSQPSGFRSLGCQRKIALSLPPHPLFPESLEGFLYRLTLPENPHLIRALQLDMTYPLVYPLCGDFYFITLLYLSWSKVHATLYFVSKTLETSNLFFSSPPNATISWSVHRWRLQPRYKLRNPQSMWVEEFSISHNEMQLNLLNLHLLFLTWLYLIVLQINRCNLKTVPEKLPEADLGANSQV